MKRLRKNKFGFTLVEMVVVLAIIVILTAVTTLVVKDFINAGNSASDSVKASQQYAKASMASVNQKFKNVGFN